MSKRQRGLTLIELMIAMMLGIFISLLVVQYLATSSRMFKRQGVDSNIEQNASFAISYLSKHIRQAGSRDGHGTEVPFFFGDCDVFSPCTSDADGDNGTEINSDRIAVQMFVGAGSSDCAGNPASGQIANVFYIDEDTAGSSMNSLFCRGYDVATETWLGNGIALINGVEQMQVVYGVADASEQIYSYLAANRVPPVTGSLTLGWDRVRAVKVALLVSDGYSTGTEDVENRNYRLFDGPATNFNDRIHRRVFSTAITINSKVP